ncbi:MAG TPA: 30S ribosome-binding factor RbfA [Haploplasma sp.]|nr:30S ribosome-binding factor RbfA [Haploplasma sp.]
MSITVERLASLIQRELAPIVNSVVQKEVIGYINLTEVKLTKDLSIAKIYYTILSDNEETLEYTQKELDKANATIRMELAKKIKNIRKIPEIKFVYDEALAYGNHIDKLLKTIK